MITNTSQGLYELLLDLVSIPSVSPNGATENAMAERIVTHLRELPYFQAHPQDVQRLPLPEDPLQRHFVFARVRAARPVAETILLLGHFDVVGVKGCGPLASLAFSPESYAAALAGLSSLPPEARADLESGKWIFGRGVSDMKCGVALCMGALAEWSERREELEADLAALFVPDEENSSLGMLAAVPLLARLQREEGVHWLACVDTEPSIGKGNKDVPAFFLGSNGKINPFFFFVGREAHVGDYYEGINAALLASAVNLLIEGNADFADSAEGELYSPFACMKHRDFRGEYSASIAERSAAYYSYLTASKLPEEILAIMKTAAMEGQKRALEHLRTAAETFARRGKPELHVRSWTPRVLSFAELYERARQRFAETQEYRKGAEAAFEAHLAELVASLPSEADARDKALALVDACVSLSGEKGPFVVVGFLFPWYPHRGNEGRTPGERALAVLAEELVILAERTHRRQLDVRPFYEGISDLSYCGFSAKKEVLDVYAANMPGYGLLYRLPLEDLLCLDIPVCNLGPLGKDEHKYTERIERAFAFEILPDLLRYVVTRLPRLQGEV